MSDASFPLEFGSKGQCLIVVRRSVSRIYCRCSDHSHDLLFYYYCCCCCCMCYPAAAGLIHWYPAVARCCSTSQPQQDYAAAGAFVCVSCLYMFSSKIYCKSKKTCVKLRRSCTVSNAPDDNLMVLCEMHHARQSPRPVLLKSLQKSSFIGRISQYFPFREVCDWPVLTKLSLRMGLVPSKAQIPYIGRF